MRRSTFSSAPAADWAGCWCAGSALADGVGLTGVSLGRSTMYVTAPAMSTPAMMDAGIHGILRGPEGAAGDAGSGDPVADAVALPAPSNAIRALTSSCPPSRAAFKLAAAIGTAT